MIKPSEVAVVVVNYNSFVLVMRQLSLLCQAVGRVYIVDNYTSNEERSRIQGLQHSHPLTAILLDENMGFGAGCNRGVEAAFKDGFEAVLLLNPDAIISTESIVQLCMASSKFPKAICSPVIRYPDGGIWFQGAVIDFDFGVARHSSELMQEGSEWLTGACMLFTRHIWQRLGGFDEDYFLYWEDVDLTYRWKELGGELRVVPSATAVHDVGGTQSGMGSSPTKLFYSCLNRMRFASRNLSLLRIRRWSACAPRYALRIVRGEKFSLLHQPFRKTWSIVAGSVAGTRLAERGL